MAPDEIALALAAYCAREKTAPGEIVLHWFPFGGWEKCLSLIGDMRDGSWPPIDEEEHADDPKEKLKQKPKPPMAKAAAAEGVSATPPQAQMVPGGEPAAAGVQPTERSECQLIDGKAIAETCLAEVRQSVAQLNAQGHSAPSLVVVLVGGHPASKAYVAKKLQAATACGLTARVEALDDTVSTNGLLDVVHNLNMDDGVHGVIVQLPLPAHIEPAQITNAVAHAKDVDGFTPQSLGAVAQRVHSPQFCPCTPKGCLRLIRSCGLPLRGKEAVVIGASNIVGVPMALLLLGEGCTVSICHIDTADVSLHTRRADVLVVAVGVAGLVKRDWVKPGAIVIDVGINFVADSTKKSGQRMVGDCAPEVATVAGHLTPVPGGVGPMTVAMLMQNTLEAKWRTVGNSVSALEADEIVRSFEAEEAAS